MKDYRDSNNNSYENETTNYEPNFIMKEPDPETTTGSTAESSASGQETSAAGQHESAGTYQHGPHHTGSFRDPRENFRSRSTYGSADDTADASTTAADNTGGFSDNGTACDPQAASEYDAMKGASASWDNHNGLGKVHGKKRESKPISLTRRSLALIIALCVFLSAGFGIGGAALGNHLSDGGSSSSSSGSVSGAGYTLEDATGSDLTVQEITAKAKSSVVEIKTESVSSDSWMQQYVTEGAGSGVIITNDGYIVTNNHVIEGANKIMVTTADEKEYEAQLVGTDSITDVAVLKIDASDLTPATYGNSDQLAVGDLAVAIGNPLGELGGTVTAGIISALDREIAIDGKTMTLLQTDSSINPGNSGGGLFNGDGQLIGIVVAKSSGSDVEGLGFAIPINTAADAAQQIMDQGYVSGQPSTGMSYTESSGQNSIDMLGNSTQSTTSVYIASVDGENAKAAGFQVGDRVYAVDDTEITSFNDLSSIVTAHEVGDTLTYTIVRDGQSMDISFQLEERTGESN